MYKLLRKLKNRFQPSTVKKGRLYYLASPYTSSDPRVMDERLREASKIAGLLIKKGIFGIYPISSSHNISQVISLGTCFASWAELDLLYVKKSEGVIVANMDGWRESVGVQAEIEYAKSIGKPVYYLHVKDLMEHNKLNTRRM